jgi:hypothetical protein
MESGSINVKDDSILERNGSIKRKEGSIPPRHLRSRNVIGR